VSCVVVLGALGAAFPAGAKKAETAATAARREDPVRRYQLGAELLRQGRPDRAFHEFEEAIRLEPDNALFIYSLGMAYQGMRDFKNAELAFTKVLDLDPFFTDAHNSLGAMFADQGQWQKARAEWERALADKNYQTPEVPRFNIGKLLCDRGLYEEALGYLRSASAAKPDQIAWRLQLAQALEKSDHLDDARSEIDAALRAKPGDIDALYQLGVVSLRLKDAAKARECFERVLQLAPGTEVAKQAGQQMTLLAP
jgi:type IV pilus assembly protein PilF